MPTDSVSKARTEVDERDLVLLAMIERFNHDGEFRPNALTVAAHIKGAPIADVKQVLDRLCDQVKVLVRINEHDFRVTQLGIEVLLLEIEGFMPSNKEQLRRDTAMARRV